MFIKAFILLCAAAAIFFIFFMQPATTSVIVGGTAIQVEVADTPGLREQGLSGREGLEKGTGMLFVFEEEGSPGIWMKDMKFPIDILWATSDGTVLTIAEAVSPSTYPEAFYPSTPRALYVLEVPAGTLKELKVAVGDNIVVQ